MKAKYKPNHVYDFNITKYAEKRLKGFLSIETDVPGGIGCIDYEIDRRKAELLMRQLEAFLKEGRANDPGIKRRSEIDRLIDDSTGPDGEMYGHRD